MKIVRFSSFTGKKKKENRARNDAHKQTNRPHGTLHNPVPFPDERYSVGSSKVIKDGYTFVTLSRKNIRFRPCQFLSSYIGPLIYCRLQLSLTKLRTSNSCST